MTETDGKKKIIVVSFLAMLIGSIMLIITLFVPFASATDDHREYLEKYANTVSIEELDITNEQLLDVSLFKFARIYSALSGMEISRDISISCIAMISVFLIMGLSSEISVFAFFALLTLLFSILRKAIPVIIFDLLTFVVFRIIQWDFEDRGVISNSKYDGGIALYIGYIGVVIVMAGAVTLLVMKIKNKKQRKVLEQ